MSSSDTSTSFFEPMSSPHPTPNTSSEEEFNTSSDLSLSTTSTSTNSSNQLNSSTGDNRKKKSYAEAAAAGPNHTDDQSKVICGEETSIEKHIDSSSFKKEEEKISKSWED